ncbi:MAG: Xaa-Pro peptidase family protein [Pseudomonadota bacterium]
MALHFDEREYRDRMNRLMSVMADQKLDAMLLFAQESMYWLTGYDTFGFCFFQCMVVTNKGEVALITRSADLRQARHTSTIENIVIWEDRADARPTQDLKDLLTNMDLLGSKMGVEYDTAGLNGRRAKELDEDLMSFAELKDASLLITHLRAIKSEAEIAYVKEAAMLGDHALVAARPLIKAGADEGAILAAMQGEIFKGGGDYPGNEFIIGSGDDALLCRYKSGRRKLDAQDQLTLEWAGAYRRYHAALMRTVVIGKPTPRHKELFAVAADALSAVEGAMVAGNTFGDVFDAHAKVMDGAGLARHRLNACGYSLGAHFTPCWMDMPMFYNGTEAPIEPNMTLFAHMIIMDSDTNTAMTLGRTYVTTLASPEPLSSLPLDLIVA